VLNEVTRHQAGLKLKVLFSVVEIVVARIEYLDGGQRFEAARQPIRGVEVTATAPGGRAVKLVWGGGRRR
jgi:hypothetical protein